MPWLILLATSVGIYCSSLGSWPYIDPGETYYTEAAREMVESGEYIVPHLNYQVYFSKPILNFWLIAASYRCFGINEFAARIPFGFLATILILATYALARKITNNKAALLAGLFTASAPLMMLFSKTSSIDLAFTVFLNLAAYAFIATVFCNISAWPILWLALALAALTKGPAGFVLFSIGTGLFLVLEKPGLKRLWYWFTSTKPLLGIPLLLVTTVPWYYLVYKATKGLFLQVFFVYENLARFQGKTNIHKSNLFFYFSVAAYGLAPWFLFSPQTLRQLFWLPFTKRWFSGKQLTFRSTYRPYARLMQNPQGADSEQKADWQTLRETFAGEHQDFELTRERSLFYLACWVIGIFVFFSISKTQLDTYILPIVAPASILLATAITSTISGSAATATKDDSQDLNLKWDQRWLNIVSWFVMLLTLAVAVAAAYAAITWSGSPHQKALLLLASAAGIAGSAAQLLNLLRKHSYEAVLAATLTICALTASIFPVAFQHFAQGQLEMRHLAEHLPDCHEEIALYGAFKPSLIHYLKRPIDTITSVDQFVVATKPIPDDGLSYGYTPSGRKQLIIGEDRYMKDFDRRPELHLRELYREGKWAVYELTNGYVERPKSLEECFKWVQAAGQSFADSNNFGPFTVPRGGGDADWYKVRRLRH